MRRVEYGESDLVVTLFTEAVGRVSALARGARASRRRFAGTLEPMHTLKVELSERPPSELMILGGSSLAVPRPYLVGNLAGLEAAGRALTWLRHTTAPHAPEPRIWQVFTRLLDHLNGALAKREAHRHLAQAGLALLGELGWGLDLTGCVSCGRACEPGRPATVDPLRGGLVCRACGGGSIPVDGAGRQRLASAIAGAESLMDSDVSLGLSLVEQTLRAHANLP